MSTTFDVVIIGAGAAGFFTAINIAEQKPELKIAILERGNAVLQKVKVSGGGRCNVTHACFDPKELTEFYPRGAKELLGPFHKFSCGDTFEWFDNHGIPLKIEDDGRVFPESNTSQTIIDCFVTTAEKHGINVMLNQGVTAFYKEDNVWKVATKSDEYTAENVVVAGGSSPKLWKLLSKIGHQVINPVPSLFTFNIADERIKDIPGVVVQSADVKVLGSTLESDGPLLITHWGLSAPSILKLSAFGARELYDRNYQFDIQVNFIQMATEDCLNELKSLKQQMAKNLVYKYTQFEVPKRLWQKLVVASSISETTRWAELTKQQLEVFANQLSAAQFKVDGKSTFKEEFVTAGGIDLKEVNFKRFESRLHANLFFAGEVLNIDAVTGGFNFQNAWTGGFIVAKAITN